jgi:ABC-type multidrug transport system permease subunit
MNSRLPRLIWRQMNVQIRVRTLSWWTLGLFVIQPAIFSAVGMLLSRLAGNAVPDLVYTVIGGGIMGMWSGLVFTSTFDITRDRRDGTLELIVGSPTSLATVVAIRTFTNVVSGLFSLSAAFLVAMLVFRYSLAGINLFGALFSLFLIMFAMWCIGVFLANFLAWSRLTGSLVDFLETPVAVFCGFMYPIRVLPVWMQAVSTVIPIRWALQGLDASLHREYDATLLLKYWASALLLSLLFWALAGWLQGKVHDRIRVTGELSSI